MPPAAARSARRIDYGRRIADRAKEVDAPFDDVGLLSDDGGDLRQHLVRRASHERRAGGRARRTQRLAADLNQSSERCHGRFPRERRTS
jgi:hypothetical protein